MISLCAACHAIVERLQVLDVWLPPQLVILWREQHPDAEYQLPLPFDPFEQSAAGIALFNPGVVELDLAELKRRAGSCQRRTLGEGKLHDILVGFASADDAVVRPNRSAHPLPLLDDSPGLLR